MNYASQATGTLVDTLGAMLLKIAALDAEQKAIKQALVDRHGEGKQYGQDFNASASNPVRSTPGWAGVARALAKKANLTDAQFDKVVAEHTTNSTYWVVKVTPKITLTDAEIMA